MLFNLIEKRSCETHGEHVGIVATVFAFDTGEVEAEVDKVNALSLDQIGILSVEAASKDAEKDFDVINLEQQARGVSEARAALESHLFDILALLGGQE